MASEQILVNVSYRSIPLIAGAVLTPEEGGRGFLKTDSPMPVGTALVLSPVENLQLQVSARVARVVEACRGAEEVENEAAGMSVVFEDGSLIVFPTPTSAAAPVASTPTQPGRPAAVPPAIAAAPTYQDVHEESDIPTVVEHPISVQVPPPEPPPAPTTASGEMTGAGPVVGQVEVLPSGAKVVIGPELYDGPTEVGATPSEAAKVAGMQTEARMVVEEPEPEDADAPDRMVYEIEADYATPPPTAAPVAAASSPAADRAAASVSEPVQPPPAAPPTEAAARARAQVETSAPVEAPAPAAEAAQAEEESSSEEAAASDEKDEGDEKKKGKRKGRRRRRK